MVIEYDDVVAAMSEPCSALVVTGKSPVDATTERRDASLLGGPALQAEVAAQVAREPVAHLAHHAPHGGVHGGRGGARQRQVEGDLEPGGQGGAVLVVGEVVPAERPRPLLLPRGRVV